MAKSKRERSCGVLAHVHRHGGASQQRRVSFQLHVRVFLFVMKTQSRKKETAFFFSLDSLVEGCLFLIDISRLLRLWNIEEEEEEEGKDRTDARTHNGEE